MTLQTLITIIIVLWGVILFIGISVLIYYYGRKSTRDNPYKASIFIRTGDHISKPIKGTFHKNTKTGISYKFFSGKKRIIMFPKKYKQRYYASKLAIFVNNIGQIIASPFEDDVELADDEKNSLIYDICASHVGSDGLNALKGKPTMPLILISLLAFLLGIGLAFGVVKYQEYSLITSQNTPIEQPKETPIEVK